MTARALRPALAVALAVAAAGALAQGAGPAGGAPRSPAVYPEPRPALRFSHARHLRLPGAGCLPCHAEVARSDDARDRALPAHARCEACHDLAAARAGRRTDPPSGCQVCHPGYDDTVQRAPAGSLFPRPNLRFSHARHLARLRGGDPIAPADAACASCHGGVGQVELAGRAQLPAMAACLRCHDGRAAGQACATCHPTAAAAAGALLQTELASGTLEPGPGDPFGLDHGPGFARTHARVALAQRERCAACHAQRFCLGCHDGTTKPQSIHAGDYVSLHPLQARQDSPRCDACHRRQSFCVACHERVGIGAEADAALRAGGPARFHPPGWTGTGGGANHGVQAARDIGQCASCHREEQCLRCHASSPAALVPGGVKPHPPGFTAVCRDLARKNDRACAKCHLDLAGAVARCQ